MVKLPPKDGGTTEKKGTGGVDGAAASPAKPRIYIPPGKAEFLGGTRKAGTAVTGKGGPPLKTPTSTSPGKGGVLRGTREAATVTGKGVPSLKTPTSTSSGKGGVLGGTREAATVTGKGVPSLKTPTSTSSGKGGVLAVKREVATAVTEKGGPTHSKITSTPPEKDPLFETGQDDDAQVLSLLSAEDPINADCTSTTSLETESGLLPSQVEALKSGGNIAFSIGLFPGVSLKQLELFGALVPEDQTAEILYNLPAEISDMLSGTFILLVPADRTVENFKIVEKLSYTQCKVLRLLKPEDRNAKVLRTVEGLSYTQSKAFIESGQYTITRLKVEDTRSSESIKSSVQSALGEEGNARDVLKIVEGLSYPQYKAFMALNNPNVEGLRLVAGLSSEHADACSVLNQPDRTIENFKRVEKLSFEQIDAFMILDDHSASSLQKLPRVSYDEVEVFRSLPEGGHTFDSLKVVFGFSNAHCKVLMALKDRSVKMLRLVAGLSLDHIDACLVLRPEDCTVDNLQILKKLSFEQIEEFLESDHSIATLRSYVISPGVHTPRTSRTGDSAPVTEPKAMTLPKYNVVQGRKLEYNDIAGDQDGGTLRITGSTASPNNIYPGGVFYIASVNSIIKNHVVPLVERLDYNTSAKVLNMVSPFVSLGIVRFTTQYKLERPLVVATAHIHYYGLPGDMGDISLILSKFAVPVLLSKFLSQVTNPHINFAVSAGFFMGSLISGSQSKGQDMYEVASDFVDANSDAITIGLCTYVSLTSIGQVASMSALPMSIGIALASDYLGTAYEKDSMWVMPTVIDDVLDIHGSTITQFTDVIADTLFT